MTNFLLFILVKNILKFTFTTRGIAGYIPGSNSKNMSDTFYNIAERAACERQIIRKSQFSKEIFSGKKKPARTVDFRLGRKEMIIIC